jgi:hypothetical protein
MKGDELPAFTSLMRMAKTQRGASIKEREVARFMAIMNSLPDALLRVLTVQQLCVAFQFDLHANTVTLMRRQYLKLKGDKDMKEGEWEPKPENIGAQLVIEKIAGVSSKTYAHLGDGEQIGSEDALRQINKILTQYDASILDRNLKRRLPGK